MWRERNQIPCEATRFPSPWGLYLTIEMTLLKRTWRMAGLNSFKKVTCSSRSLARVQAQGFSRLRYRQLSRQEGLRMLTKRSTWGNGYSYRINFTFCTRYLIETTHAFYIYTMRVLLTCTLANSYMWATKIFILVISNAMWDAGYAGNKFFTIETLLFFVLTERL